MSDPFSPQRKSWTRPMEVDSWIDSSMYNMFSSAAARWEPITVFFRKFRVYGFKKLLVELACQFAVCNPVQMAPMRKEPPAAIEKSIVVETNISQGFVLVKALQPYPSREPAIAIFLPKHGAKNCFFVNQFIMVNKLPTLFRNYSPTHYICQARDVQ